MPGESPTAINILYLDHAPIFGGAEVVLINLVTKLDRARYTPLVATSANAAFRSALDRSHIAAIVIPFDRLNHSGVLLPLHLVQAVAAVVHVIQERHIGLLHTNTVRAHIVGSLAAVLTRTPLIWTLHDNTFLLRLVKLLAAAPRQVICVSQWLQVLYSPQGLGKKATVLYNGLDLAAPLEQEAGLREELGVPATAPFFINVGRLVAGKAPHLFVQAAKELSCLRPDAYFALVGGADDAAPGQPLETYPEQLAKVIQESNLGKHLIMTGQRSDVGRFYAAADALVYTSVQPEGLPTVLLEAMRHCLPVVASSIGGAAEIVVDDVTGLLVLPGDVSALTSAMLRLLADRERARVLGIAGRERLAHEFDLDRQVKQTQAIYEQVLNRDRR